MPLRAALFLDRDGTLIEDPGYLADPAGVRLLPGVVDALRQLRAAGWLLVVVSNQSGVARGLISPEAAQAVHDRFITLFADQGVSFDAVLYCPHGPQDGCPCRKPQPGLLLQAAQQLPIDLARSWMVGDKPSDIEAGHRVGCTGLLLAPPMDWPTIAQTLTRPLPS